MADDVLAVIETPQGELFCPHCEHFMDLHMGLPFHGGPNREWRFHCRCGCTVDLPTHREVRLLDPETYAPHSGSNDPSGGR